MTTLIGPHITISKGIENVPVIASTKYHATTFGLFLGNVKRWESKPITEDIAQKFKDNCESYGYNLDKIVPHAKYMINLCNPDDEKVKKSRNAMIDEMKRANVLGLSMVNVHPGSSLGQYDDNGASYRIAKSVNYILEKTNDTKLVLETTAGQGNDYGWNFEQLGSIIDKVEDKSRIGVCIDTCHIYAAGYSFDSKESMDNIYNEFVNIIGLDYLSAIHLNNSLMPCGKRKDRHGPLGMGYINPDNLKYFIHRFENIPCILETPNSLGWKQEIRAMMI